MPGIANNTAAPNWRGIPLKYIALATLVVQNSMLVLVLRYSRTLPGKPYVEPTAVVMCELIKLAICVFIFWRNDLETLYQDEHYLSLPTNLESAKSPAQARLRKDSATTLNELEEESPILTRLPESTEQSKLGWKTKKAYEMVFGDSVELFKIAIPASLYFIQNNLQYVAATYLDAATFQVTYQMKILTTALCSVLILGRKLSATKWASLLVLTLGIILVQMPTGSSNARHAVTLPLAARAETRLGTNSASVLPDSPPEFKRKVRNFSLDKRDAALIQQTLADVPLDVSERELHLTNDENSSEDARADAAKRNGLIGLIAVSTACLLSGLAGVYFEKVLKGSKSSLWARNIQMSFCSVLPGFLIGCLIYERERILAGGFFQGYNFWTWACIFNQAAGGLLVALVVKYADNILKGFATSISIICSSIVSVWLFDFHISSAFIFGSSLVIYATFLYGGVKFSISKMFQSNSNKHVKLSN